MTARQLHSYPVYFGAPLARPFASILNSRQSRMPCGSDSWVINTIAAVKDVVARGFTVLTSIEMNTWELVIWAVNELGGKQIIVYPFYSGTEPKAFVDRITRDFELDLKRTGFLFFETDKPTSRPKLAWPDRDALILRESEFVYPISVRNNGNISALLRDYKSAKKVNRDYVVNYQKKRGIEVLIPNKEEVERRFSGEKWNYLTHWTRTFYGPWPGETSRDYYSAIVNSEGDYPRSGFESLINIIRNMKIAGSGWHIREGMAAVSFTSLSLPGATELMKYRSRWGRYTFEPYGIAIDKEAAEHCGIRPVIYGDSKLYDSLDDKDRPYFQSSGTRGDWKAEREYRFIGDLDLRSLPERSMRMIVPGQDECEKVSAITDIEAIVLS